MIFRQVMRKSTAPSLKKILCDAPTRTRQATERAGAVLRPPQPHTRAKMADTHRPSPHLHLFHAVLPGCWTRWRAGRRRGVRPARCGRTVPHTPPGRTSDPPLCTTSPHSRTVCSSGPCRFLNGGVVPRQGGSRICQSLDLSIQAVMPCKFLPHHPRTSPPRVSEHLCAGKSSHIR